jgi:hypothetical protein
MSHLDTRWSALAVLVATALLAAAQSGEGKPPDKALPGWLMLGAEIRGRAEANTGIRFEPRNDDSYYLHRLRLNATIQPQNWLRFFIQAQDSRAPGYSQRPVPNTVADTLDLHQGYLELGLVDKGGWAVRLGRQELIFGEERLVGASNWSNVGRAFDAARLTYRRPGARLDWFAAAAVVPVNGPFDRPRLFNGFYGFYSTFDRLIRESALEPYFLWKTNSQAREDRYTAGARALGKLPHRLDYNLEMAFQTGRWAQDTIRAWAGHWVLGYALLRANGTPRLVLEYNYASGDANPSDRRRGTFDQLFPTNHNKYGTADRIAWRNIHDLMGGVEWRPTRKWKWNLDYHSFWLASRQDALYTEAGVVFTLNPKARASRVGQELDLQAAYQLSERLQLGFGYAHLFAGPYLKESTTASSVTYPFLMWGYRF